MRAYFFTEGGKGRGAGHVTRCLSIAQAFKERGIQAVFYLDGDGSAGDILSGVQYELINWIEHSRTALKNIKGDDIVIVDSYDADFSFYSEVSRIAGVPAYIDDTMRIEYPKGVVINGSVGAESMPYPRPVGMRYLLGTQYIPLRKAFWQESRKHIRKSVRKVMVTFGGEDPAGMTHKVVDLFRKKFTEIELAVVVGKGFKGEFLANPGEGEKIKYVFYPDDGAMRELMLDADLAVSAGGQTLYELARTGVPTITFAVAENQSNNIYGWEKAGFIKNAGYCYDPGALENLEKLIMELSDENTRLSMSLSGNALVDGKGAMRVADSIVGRLRREA